MSKEKDIIVTGTFLTVQDVSNRLHSLHEMEECIKKINNKNHKSNPRISAAGDAFKVCLGMLFAFLLLHEMVDPFKNTEHEVSAIIEYSIIAVSFVAFAILVYIYIKDVPKTHTEELVMLLTRYKPMDEDGHKAIIQVFEESRTLNLSGIMLFIKNERRSLLECNT